ncbi:RRM domain-containing protein [Plasmodiophora brassicae]|uniref:RRM domain-containing protein n=1 Tax=Plasmodiophora brassicae TaxID=37360 RepID=A0A0G4J4K1_PLABS|nr:hypothetical protein PBRA_009089 [Plasmodiophora brassicae]SPR01720.1 unnamed protein product [Plasmodiophora brassicae]
MDNQGLSSATDSDMGAADTGQRAAAPAAPTPSVPAPAAADDDGTVFVGGINWKATEAELLDFFESAIGHALHCRIITDRETSRSKGYGFVTFASADLARQAKMCGPLVFMGKTLNIHDAYRRYTAVPAPVAMQEQTEQVAPVVPVPGDPFYYEQVQQQAGMPSPFPYVFVMPDGTWYPSYAPAAYQPTGGYIVQQPYASMPVYQHSPVAVAQAGSAPARQPIGQHNHSQDGHRVPVNNGKVNGSV